jgi:hypothetical protein
MIMDVCENGQGERLYLIGFSFMPAQEFHIEKAPGRLAGRSTRRRGNSEPYGKEGWFSYGGYIRYLEEYYPFGEPVLRRFE